jgi:hypothetical protein
MSFAPDIRYVAGTTKTVGVMRPLRAAGPGTKEEATRVAPRQCICQQTWRLHGLHFLDSHINLLLYTGIDGTTLIPLPTGSFSGFCSLTFWNRTGLFCMAPSRSIADLLLMTLNTLKEKGRESKRGGK